MRSRMIGVSVVSFLAGSAICLAADVQIGTWKLNEAKSKIPAGAAKNLTVVYEVIVDKVKVTVDGVDADGRPTHTEWAGKYDGIFYPVVGDPTSDLRAYKRVNAHTLALSVKKDDKVTVTGTIVVAKDGKSRTVSTSGVNAKGEKISTTAVYDKQ